MTISNEAIEAAARALFEANYANGSWGLVRGNDKKHYVHRARAVLEASAPFIRAGALEDAAVEIDRLTQIGRTPVREVSQAMESDYKAFVDSGSIPAFLVARAKSELENT